MFLFVSAALVALLASSLGDPILEKNQCTRFDSKVCSSLNYSHAYLPQNTDMYIVEERLGGYDLLVASKCHPSLLEFLCFSYYPFCQPGVQMVVRPCQSLCLDVKEKCVGLIEAAGFKWPQELECSAYPESGQCLEGKKVDSECRPCNLVKQKDVLHAACSKEKSLYARIKILEKLVLHGRTAYKAQLLSLYRPILFHGGEADDGVKEVTILTEGTPDCPCVKMTVGVQYFVGGIYFSTGYNPLYILPNDAIIKRWKEGGSFGRKIDRCLITVDE